MAAIRAAAPHAGAAWIVILAGVSAALHVGKLPPALPVLQGELGITLVQAGFLLSLVQLASMTLGIVAGLMADGIGLKRCVVTGLALLSAAGLAGGFAHDATALLALRAAEGLGFLLTTVPAPSLVRRTVAPAAPCGVWPNTEAAAIGPTIGPAPAMDAKWWPIKTAGWVGQ